MKVILNIENNKAQLFMKLVKSLDYITVMKEVKDKQKSEFITDLADSFNDINFNQVGKKKLKSAKSLLNEL